MPSLMNGLSAMGQSVSAFAGTAGLEQQRSDLQRQGMVLADQLATTREHVGRVEAGEIAATAAQAGHGYAMEEGKQRGEFEVRGATIRASAELGAAGIAAAASKANTQAIISAQAPLVAEQVKSATANAGLLSDQQKLADQSLGLTQQILEESAKPPEQQDRTKLDSLTNQRAQLGMSADSQIKLLGTVTDLAKNAQQNAIMLDANVARVLAQEATLNMGDPKVRDAQKAEEASALAQRNSALDLAQYYANLAKSYTGKLPNAPAAAAPAPAGKPVDLNPFYKGPGAPASPATPTPPSPGLIPSFTPND